MNCHRISRTAALGAVTALVASGALLGSGVLTASASDSQCGFQKVGYDTSQEVCLTVNGSGLKVTEIDASWDGSPPAVPVYQFYVNGTLKYTHTGTRGTSDYFTLPTSFDHSYANNTQMKMCIAAHGYFESTCTQIIYVHS